jgi:restriction system protein
MTQNPSRSARLIAAMHHAALTALAASPHGRLHVDAILQAIEATANLDDWARVVYDNGNTRWRSIFAFASVGLVKGGYVTKSRGVWAITDEGRAVANAPYDGLALLAEVNRRYQAWKGSQLAMPFHEKSDTAALSPTMTHDDDTTPDDLDAPEPPEVRMATILRQANEALSAELLEKIKAESPAFFEQLVVQLLVAMGYGGNRANAGQVTQLSADNGIDGIINEDPLGLDTIYLQAKRWQDPVGEGPVRSEHDVIDVTLAAGAQINHFPDVRKMVVDVMSGDFASRFGFANDIEKIFPLGITQQMLDVPCQPVRHTTFGLLRMALKGDGEGVDQLFFHGKAPLLTSFSMASN